MTESSKTANMFASGAPTSGGEPVSVSGGESTRPASGFRGFVRDAPKSGAAVKPGIRPRQVDSRLFPGLDIQEGLSKMGKGSVSLESVMSKDEAGAINMKILDMWGLRLSVEEGVIFTVFEMLFRSCAFNGTSTAQPGRAVIHVMGQKFDVKEVVIMLGDNFRRWARANADNIRDAMVRIVRDYDLGDPDAADAYNTLMRVALARGMQRQPTLCFDVADYCSGLSLPESTAIAAAKETVLSNTVNVPDAALATGRAHTVDGYEGGVGAVREHAAGAAVGSHR